MTVGLLALLIGLLGRQKGRAAIYGLICLTFIGYAWYPIIMTMLGGSALLYALERFCFCAMLAAVMLLGRGLCGLKARWDMAFPIFGAAVCAASLAVPLFLGNLVLMLAYSHLISVYEWIAAGFLTFAAGRAVLKGSLLSARRWRTRTGCSTTCAIISPLSTAC